MALQTPVACVLLVLPGTDGFEVFTADTRQPIARGLPSLQAALDIARVHGCTEIWQQHLDLRRRPLGDPFRLPVS